MKKSKVSLQKMIFYGYHGCLESEKEIGQLFEVDVELVADFSRAAATDNLEDTLDYSAVYHIVRELVEGPPFKLLEALGTAIAQNLLKTFSPQEITVRVRKPNPPVGGIVAAAEYEITLNQTE